jgi:hypothetical protein
MSSGDYMIVQRGTSRGHSGCHCGVHQAASRSAVRRRAFGHPSPQRQVQGRAQARSGADVPRQLTAGPGREDRAKHRVTDSRQRVRAPDRITGVGRTRKPRTGRPTTSVPRPPGGSPPSTQGQPQPRASQAARLGTTPYFSTFWPRSWFWGWRRLARCSLVGSLYSELTATAPRKAHGRAK